MAGETSHDTCEVQCVTPAVVTAVRRASLSHEEVARLAEVFKVLGEPTRVRIIHALAIAEMCVCDLADALGMTNSAVSHQLRVLRNLRLVRFRKDGKSVYYTLDDHHILNLFQEGLEHVRHS